MEFRRELSEYNLSELQTLVAQVYAIASRRNNAAGPSLEELGQALYQLTIPEELHALFERNSAPLASATRLLWFRRGRRPRGGITRR